MCPAVYLGALGAALLLMPALAAAEAPPACPSNPIRVVRSAGGVVDYLGAVPGLPELCRMRRSDGDGDFYLGIWRSDWPGAGLAYPAIRAAMHGPGDAQDSRAADCRPVVWAEHNLAGSRDRDAAALSPLLTGTVRVQAPCGPGLYQLPSALTVSVIARSAATRQGPCWRPWIAAPQAARNGGSAA